MTVAAVVLAAGEASRFGSPKQRLLLPAVLERLSQAALDDVVIVEGAHELEPPSCKLLQGDVRIVRCDDWALGPGASLRCGLADAGGGVAGAGFAGGDSAGGPSRSKRWTCSPVSLSNRMRKNARSSGLRAIAAAKRSSQPRKKTRRGAALRRASSRNTPSRKNEFGFNDGLTCIRA